jgi:hypothetical protein
MTNTAERTRPVNSDERCEQAVAELRRLYREHRYVEVDFRVGERQRTMTQNRALHLWFEFLADTLNDAGLDMRKTLREGVEIPWSKHTVKQYIWKPVQQALQNKRSTTDANRTDYTEVREAIAEHLYNRFGVVAPEWPKRDREVA